MACCLQVRLYTPPDLSEQQTLYQTVYQVVLGHHRMLHPNRQQVGRVLRNVIARRMYIIWYAAHLRPRVLCHLTQSSNEDEVLTD